MPPTLRPYQNDIVQGVRQKFREKHQSVVIVSPTGSGKGTLLPYVASGVVRNDLKVLIMAHRQNLIDQLCEALDSFDLCYSVISGRKHIKYNCMIGMVQTIAPRLSNIPEPDYILVDEGHHSTADTYLKIFEKFPNAKRILLTATPEDANGDGLIKVASAMVIGPTVRWLIEQGFLSRYTYIKPPSSVDLASIKYKANGDVNEKSALKQIRKSFHVGDAVDLYRKWMDGKPNIVFCVDISHAKEVAEAYQKAGYRAEAISGLMSRSEQKRLLGGLKTGEVQVLCSADLIGEGTDIPCLQGIQMLRPSKSIVIVLQQWGRALRVKPDGSNAIIIDHMQNCVDMGFPCDVREWSLEPKKKKGEVCLKTCDRCQRSFHAHEAKEKAAEECSDEKCPMGQVSIERPQHEREFEVIDVEMEVIEDPWAWLGGINPALASGAEYTAMMEKADSVEKLKQICRARGYNHRWATVQAVKKGLIKETRQFRKYSKR